MVPLHIQLANSTLRRVIKRLHFPLEVMLVCVRWYAAYPLSLRHIEEMMAERGVLVDHATVHRWAMKMLPVLAAVLRRRKLPVGPSWRVDETYYIVPLKHLRKCDHVRSCRPSDSFWRLAWHDGLDERH
jgi:transposase-like protein